MAKTQNTIGLDFRASASAAALVLATGAFAAPLALAQDQDAQAPGEQTKTLSTVTVVAQKREQNILEVPVAVSAVSAEMLENAGASDFSSLTRVAPSLTVNQGNNTNNNSINLRGIGTYAFSIGVEPSVSVIIDDVPVVQQAQAFNSLADIERVEVLRGPQGTLFGKNASAGVVNIVTKGPSDVLSGSLEGIFTDDDEVRLNASLSGPLGDAAGFRLNGYAFERDGHVTNLFDGSDLNNDEGWGVRGRFEADLSDALTASVILDYSEREANSFATTFRDVPAGAALFGVAPAAAITSGITPGEDNYNARQDDQTLSENEQFAGSLKLTYDIGDFQLVSVSSFQDWSYLFEEDVDGTDFDLLNVFTSGALNGGIFQSGPFSAEQFTQEFRLISPQGDHFEYLLGLWYSDAETDRTFARGPIFVADWGAATGTTNYAAFGQGTFHVSDKLDITAGLRVGTEEIDVSFTDIANPGQFTGDDSESFVTGKLAAQYFFDNDISLFAAVSTGYKGQGFDVSSGFNQARADNPVGSETSISYEAGLKGRLFDDRAQFSLVAFLTDYEDFQAQSAEVTPTGLVFNLNNVGELRTQGIEADFSAQLNDYIRIDTSAALIDASIESFPNATCYPGQTVAEGCVETAPGSGTFLQDLSGADLSNSPDFKFNIGATFEKDLTSMPFGIFANANYQYQDDVNFDLFANPRTVQDGYGIMNVNLGVRDLDDRYRVTVFVNNLFEEEYVSGIIDQSGFFGGVPVLRQFKPRQSQRYVGVRLKGSF